MPTAAPVLALHHCGGRCYELSGLRTTSVRDQILRAQMLVSELLKDPTLDPDLPLLVIGGGAAGGACAITAIKANRRAVLFEREADPFVTQLYADQRWIDPTEFDWPQPHWMRGVMRSKARTPALSITADYAPKLAAHWRYELDQADKANPGLLSFEQGDARTWKIQDSADGRGVIKVAAGADSDGPPTFCAAISCIGFSGEKTEVAASNGATVSCPKFWGVDDIDLADLGTGRVGSTTDEEGRLHALVSGNGDGAMQDFQRLATKSMGKKLWDRLNLAGWERSPPMLQAMLAEDAARRAHLWCGRGVTPTKAYVRWQAAYDAVANAIWATWKMPDRDDLADRILRPNISVTWNVGSSVPGYAYGLNRLLTDLVARLIAHRGRRDDRSDGVPATRGHGDRAVIVLNRKLVLLTPADTHVCSKTCFDQPHLATLQRDVLVGGADDFEAGPFDFVVARHGIRHEPYFGGAAVTEQIVPFDFPE
jgi:hypothetical protein